MCSVGRQTLSAHCIRQQIQLSVAMGTVCLEEFKQAALSTSLQEGSQPFYPPPPNEPINTVALAFKDQTCISECWSGLVPPSDVNLLAPV